MVYIYILFSANTRNATISVANQNFFHAGSGRAGLNLIARIIRVSTRLIRSEPLRPGKMIDGTGANAEGAEHALSTTGATFGKSNKKF